MAHIEKRAKRGQDGATHWRARYIDPAGKERSRTFARKVDAERFLASVEGDKLRGAWTDPRLGKTRFERWAEEWWATTADLRPSTRVRVRGIIDGYLIPTFGPSELASITHLAVRSWVAGLSAQGLAPRTVRKIAQTLAKVLSAAVDARLLATSPCDRVPLPKAEDEEMRFLDPSEVKTLAEAMDPRYRALVLVAAYGGLRLGELVGLRRRRVDLLRGRIEVVETGVEAGGVVRFGPPKSRAGRRSVTLPADAVQALREHMLVHTAPEADALVFTSPRGGVLRASNWRQEFWKPAVRRAGLEPLRIHDLRHTAVALWIAAGAHPKEVQVRAGHSSVAFTLDRYGHLFPEADERLRDRLDAFLAAATANPSAPVRSLPGMIPESATAH